MTTIGSIGIGLFILIILWIFTLILFVISVRLQSNWGWIGLVVVLGVTIIFALIPLESQNKVVDASNEEKDYQHIYKYILFASLIISFLSLLLIFFFTYCLEPIRPKPLKEYS